MTVRSYLRLALALVYLASAAWAADRGMSAPSMGYLVVLSLVLVFGRRRFRTL